MQYPTVDVWLFQMVYVCSSLFNFEYAVYFLIRHTYVYIIYIMFNLYWTYSISFCFYIHISFEPWVFRYTFTKWFLLESYIYENCRCFSDGVMFCAKELRKHPQNSLKGSRFDILLRVIFPLANLPRWKITTTIFLRWTLEKLVVYIITNKCLWKKGLKFNRHSGQQKTQSVHITSRWDASVWNEPAGRALRRVRQKSWEGRWWDTLRKLGDFPPKKKGGGDYLLKERIVFQINVR